MLSREHVFIANTGSLTCKYSTSLFQMHLIKYTTKFTKITVTTTQLTRTRDRLIAGGIKTSYDIALGRHKTVKNSLPYTSPNNCSILPAMLLVHRLGMRHIAPLHFQTIPLGFPFLLSHDIPKSPNCLCLNTVTYISIIYKVDSRRQGFDSRAGV